MTKAKEIGAATNRVFIVSTMTGSVNYNFHKTIDGLPRLTGRVTIRGGANLPSQKSGYGDQSQNEEGVPMWTPSGVVTPISAEQYGKLKDHWLFKRHVESGRVSVSERDVMDNHRAVKKITEGMEKKDTLAQLTPSTLKDRVKVVTNKEDASMSDIKFI